MAMRIITGAALAVLTVVAMPVVTGAAEQTARSEPPYQVQDPVAPPAEQSVHNCYVKGERCIDLFKQQVEPCDVKQHPCDVKPRPMPAQPQRPPRDG